MTVVVPFTPSMDENFGLPSNVASGAANTVVSAVPCKLVRVVVTTAGSNSTGFATVYDNATTGTGMILGALAANTAIGTILELKTHAVNGVTVNNVATGPVLLVVTSPY